MNIMSISSQNQNYRFSIFGIDSDFNVSNYSNDHWLNVDRFYIFYIVHAYIRFQFIIDKWHIIDYYTQSLNNENPHNNMIA